MLASSSQSAFPIRQSFKTISRAVNAYVQLKF